MIASVFALAVLLAAAPAPAEQPAAKPAAKKPADKKPAAKKSDAKGRATSPEGVKLFGMRGYPPQEEVKDPATFFPLIDTFGQYIHREWPGKVHAAADLEAAKKAEARDLLAKPGPKDWNQYGGWKAGPALKATGHFRTEKVDGRWWLVDPEGRLFWSHGNDCVGSSADTRIDGREAWFKDFPGAQPEFKPFLHKTGPALKGDYTDRAGQAFDFAKANALRKYGPDWRQATADLAHRRLRSWGMNTIANWSSADIYMIKRTPYTANVWFHSRPIAASTGYWGQFKDPYEPEFAEKLKAALAKTAAGTADDPWCLGYFIDNEIGWGSATDLATASLASPPEQAAKKAMIEFLKGRYADIVKLNAAWGTSHASWEALAAATAAPDKKRAAADLEAMTGRIAEQYFRVIRDTVRAIAPKKLYLGCRFAWVNDPAAVAASKFCDVVTYNRYKTSVADLKLPAGADDKPLLIGEFHFGALDRGMFHTGLVPTASQAARAEAYKSYVQGALANPLLVGTHWFKYQDEPTTGRPLDEENYQIGFVDICDTPYAETIEASRAVGYGMYAFRKNAK